MTSTAQASDRTVKRAQVPLTLRDLADLQLLLESPSGLSGLDLPADPSRAAVLGALVREALRARRERLDAAAYAQLAADPEEQAIRAAITARRTRHPSRDLDLDLDLDLDE